MVTDNWPYKKKPGKKHWPPSILQIIKYVPHLKCCYFYAVNVVDSDTECSCWHVGNLMSCLETRSLLAASYDICVWRFSVSVRCTSLGGLDPETFQESHFVYVFGNCVCVFEFSFLLHALSKHSTYSPSIVSSWGIFLFRVNARTESII